MAREVITMDKFPNDLDVIHFVGDKCYNLPGKLVLLMPRMKGDLMKYLSEYQYHNLRSSNFWRFDMIYKFVSALDKFHSKGFMHLDIKPANLFMFTDYTIVLGDLGLSTNKNKVHTYMGTPSYMDPSYKSDGYLN